ncbi:glycosyltransferase [Mycobacterium tilburgii]|uniref:glycosyltransferase n=1 Tax=Mycobacterium tilburgii TaxID=44467 RepID=UPI0021B334BA|nr:glycosyltransferase [Mycobacterium tilburgii]
MTRGAGYYVSAARVGPAAARSAADTLPFVGDWAAALQRRWGGRPARHRACLRLGGLAAQLAARRQGRPTVQTFESLVALSKSTEDRADYSAHERIEPLLARHADWVTVESTAELEALTRLLHSRARVSVLSGGVDDERYTPVGRAAHRNGPLQLLCVAPNPLWTNGFDIAFAALPRVGSSELIAETEPDNRRNSQARATLERLAGGLGVAERVRFLRAFDHELPSLIRTADILVCTLRRPPRAAPVLQAMASGVAVVDPPVGALADLVVTEVTALVLSADDPKELTWHRERLQWSAFGAAAGGGQPKPGIVAVYLGPDCAGLAGDL